MVDRRTRRSTLGDVRHGWRGQRLHERVARRLGIAAGTARERRLRLAMIAAALVALAITVGLAAYRLAWAPQIPALATVDGGAVTQTDLDAEARAAGLGPDKLNAPTRHSLLQRVITRRLLADAAHRQGIDAHPMFIADRARADEMLLASAIARRFAARADPVSDAEARQFIAANPAMFAARQTITIDAITIDAITGNLNSDAVRNPRSLDEAASQLKTMGIAFTRATQRLDTASVSAPLAARLGALRPGEIFVQPLGGQTMIAAMTARVPNVAPPAEQLALARAAAARQQAQAAVASAIAALRKRARIDYAATH